MTEVQKKAIADHLLDNGTVLVHIDPRKLGVVIPPWLTHQAHVVLQFGHNMPIPIPDLSTNRIGIYGTLSFSRTSFRCVVPWSAVFALVGDSGRGQVWPEDMPAEVAAQTAADKSAVVTLKNVKPGLSFVRGGAKLTTPARGVLKSVK
jgi:hypothetical protein